MEPAFADGDLVLIEPVGVRRFRAEALCRGQVIVARHPYKNLDVIKVVVEVDDGYVTVRSPSGEDSRQFGRIALAAVKGRVTANLSQRKAVGLEAIS